MNGARNIVLQPDDAIVVSFGSGDKLTLPGVDVVQGLARQPDGKFIPVGSATTSTAAAAARRVSILDAFPGRLRRVGCFATDLCAGKVYPSGARAL